MLCCGFLATFWLPVLRIFLAPMDCDYFGQIYPYGNPSGKLKMQDVINLNWSTKEDDGRAKVDELCNSGAGGFALWGSCILVVIVFCLAFAFQSLGTPRVSLRSWILSLASCSGFRPLHTCMCPQHARARTPPRF